MLQPADLDPFRDIYSPVPLLTYRLCFHPSKCELITGRIMKSESFPIESQRIFRTVALTATVEKSRQEQKKKIQVSQLKKKYYAHFT